MQDTAVHNGPPYQPDIQLLGEIPKVLPDVPVTVIFLCLFLAVGIAHGVLHGRNASAGKKFHISALIAGKAKEK